MPICKHCGDFYGKFTCPLCKQKPVKECRLCHGEVAHRLILPSERTSKGLSQPKGHLSRGQRKGRPYLNTDDNWNGSLDNAERAIEEPEG